ncbi:MAG: transcriptional regulator NrdR [bacterium]
MKCPFCDNLEHKVLESREAEEGTAIRRRRECDSCRGRFTSYERVEEKPLMVIKRDGRREQFARDKIIAGIVRASEKRPVSIEMVEEIVNEIEKEVHREGGREVTSAKIGELVMDKLQEIDKIAFVRFASVYRKFEHPEEFIKEVEEINIGG